MNDDLELIRISRIILNLEQQEKKNELHNKWLIESERRWRQDRGFVPYPEMILFPSEKEVLLLARDLKEFLNNRSTVTDILSTETTKEEPPIQSRPAMPTFPMEPDVDQPSVDEPEADKPMDNVYDAGKDKPQSV